MPSGPDRHAVACMKFWLDAGYDAWFSKDDSFDTEFRRRFLDQHYAAARRDLDDWSRHFEGSFALMILLDQFPRNSFRGTGHMYATDPLARHFAREALAAGHDREIVPDARVFFYLPFSHSESLVDQELAVELNRNLGDKYIKHAIGHYDIVKRFGHFPHRNRILGRETTAEEQIFLDEGGFAG